MRLDFVVILFFLWYTTRMKLNELTKQYDFRFSKQYGQNFIGDENLLRAIVSDARISKDDAVLEIGPGAGTLTKEIARQASRVLAVEIDKSLQPILEDSLWGVDNAEVMFCDAMKTDNAVFAEELGGRYALIANLPYYITTPILFKFLSDPEVKSITVMVQKEVAERICASPSTSDYGALTVSVALRGKATITRQVHRSCFTPPPNVDSAVVHIQLKDYDRAQAEKTDKVIKAAFAMKRKTLVNNLSAGFGMSKTKAAEILEQMGLPATVRAEQLSAEQFVALTSFVLG